FGATRQSVLARRSSNAARRTDRQPPARPALVSCPAVAAIRDAESVRGCHRCARRTSGRDIASTGPASRTCTLGPARSRAASQRKPLDDDVAILQRHLGQADDAENYAIRLLRWRVALERRVNDTRDALHVAQPALDRKQRDVATKRPRAFVAHVHR